MAKQTSTTKGASVLTEEEKAAMRDLARERKAARSGKGDGLADVLAKIAEMPEPDRSMAQRLHELVLATAPDLKPKTWYGMPAYARDGKVICFFQSGDKFKTRYGTFSFTEDARIDDGTMWPVGFGITELNDENLARIEDLVRRA
jgi:uncharacterized protein YdhG (YjbR/CyaY superfamily)